jgi:hypothetical protein
MSINVRVELDTVRWRQIEAGTVLFSPAKAEPYLWTVFFKIDDSALTGQPVATVVGLRGSHGDLGVGSVHPPASVPVPTSIGRWDTGLRPLPAGDVPLAGSIKAIIGVVAVLMEEDNVTDDGAEAGRRELVKQVQQVMDGIAKDLVSALLFDVEKFKKSITDRIEGAIQSQQNVLENLWSFLDKDDMIGALLAYRQYSEIDDQATPIAFSEIWVSSTAGLGTWEWSLDGKMTKFARPQPTFSRTVFDFGSVPAGVPSTRLCVISNFTHSDLTLTMTSTGSHDFHLSTQSLSIPTSATASLSLSYIPNGPGSDSATVKVTRQDSGETAATLFLEGRSPNKPPP